MIRPLLSLMSPGGSDGRLSILIFHRVLDRPDPLFPDEVDRRRFDVMCGWLRSWFTVLPLDTALRQLKQGELPARAAAITFDDGYADNCTQALPVLQRHGLSACFFIATDFIGGGRMWNDTVVEALRGTTADDIELGDLIGALPGAAKGDVPRDVSGRMPLHTPSQRRAAIDHALAGIKYLVPGQREQAVAALSRRCGVSLPTDLMMSREQLLQLRRAGMVVGAHTLSHPILGRLDDAQAWGEIVGGKRALERMLDQPVGLFAYPNGKPGKDYNPRSVELVREAGFEAAVSTAWGAAGASSDLFQIPRFTPWDRSRWRFGARLLRNLRSR